MYREIKVSRVLISKMTKPLVLDLCQRLTHCQAYGSSFLLLLSKVETKHDHPKILRKEIFGDLLYRSWQGDLFCKSLLGVLYIQKIAWLTA